MKLLYFFSLSLLATVSTAVQADTLLLPKTELHLEQPKVEQEKENASQEEMTDESDEPSFTTLVKTGMYSLVGISSVAAAAISMEDYYTNGEKPIHKERALAYTTAIMRLYVGFIAFKAAYTTYTKATKAS